MARKSFVTFEKAVQILNSGGVVAVPTETVYGLAGLALNDEAVRKIFAVKKRPFFDPLIVHVASMEHVQKVARLDDENPHFSSLVTFLMKTFWPGPLTLILPKQPDLSELVTSGLPTVGVRMPRHELTLRLIEAVGPLAAPSANLFGKTSPTTALHVADEFQDQVPVLDGGPCEMGLESTVVGFENVKGRWTLIVYRPGLITHERLQKALSEADFAVDVIRKESPVAPGHLRHHYMPRIPLVLVTHTELEKYRDVVMKELSLKEWRPFLLALENDAPLVARKLYSNLRQASESGANSIICPIPEHAQGDIWEAILSRLEKAASLDLRPQ